MKIWTTEHVFGHSWDAVVRGQWQKYPNPHNEAVLGTDVVERRVDGRGVLHSHRLIASDWGLADWVQRLVGGANRTCYAHEYSTVDPARRTMELSTVNLTFCNLVSMREVMSYSPHPEDPAGKTLLKQEMVVTVRGVPLTSYMESLILGTVSANAGKGRRAIDWIVEKLSSETRLDSIAYLSQTKFTLFVAFCVHVSFMFPPLFSETSLSPWSPSSWRCPT